MDRRTLLKGDGLVGGTVIVSACVAATPAVSQGSIFEQEQLARAVELRLGIDGPERIELKTSATYAKKIKELLYL